MLSHHLLARWLLAVAVLSASLPQETASEATGIGSTAEFAAAKKLNDQHGSSSLDVPQVAADLERQSEEVSARYKKSETDKAPGQDSPRPSADLSEFDDEVPGGSSTEIKKKLESAAEQTMTQVAPLLTDDSQTRDRFVDDILLDRKTVVQQLILLIDPENAEQYSDETRCAAAYLLGELRSVEGVPVLSRALADPPGRKVFTDISRYDSPVFNALVKIGRPAIPAMIENVRTTDNEQLRKSSLTVLYHLVGGKQRVLQLLLRLNDRALNKEPADREGAVHFREARAFAERHFKEDEVPLY